MSENGRDRVRLSIADRLQKYTFRSLKQIMIHVVVSFMLAIILYFVLSDRMSVSNDNFVAITASMTAASGALLAVTIALASFYSLHVTDWRDKLIERLAQAGAAIREQMQKSAQRHPEISRHLAALYDKAVGYIPGQSIDTEEIGNVAKIFVDWANEQVKTRARELDPGDPVEYDSFELHLRDALLCHSKARHTLTLLSVVSMGVRAITTFTPLVVGWVVTLLVTLTLAIIGGIGVIPENLSFPVLVIPFWLFLVAAFALVKDITAVLSHLRGQETAYDEALKQLSGAGNSNYEDIDVNKGRKK